MINVKTSTAQTEKYIELHASSLNCMQAHDVSSWNCIQAYRTAYKLMELHASSWNALAPLTN